MSFLDDIPSPSNHQDPQYTFLVDELFEPLDSVSRETLGVYPTITSKKQAIIEKFVTSYKTHVGNNIFPSLRLILPNKDHRLFYIKHTQLVVLIIKLFKIPKHSLHYNSLVNWKRNYHNLKYNQDKSNLSNLSLTICNVVSFRRDKHYRITQNLTVNDVNHLLDQLSQASGQAKQLEILHHLLSNLTINQMRWVLNAILKISNLGYMERFIFHQWHPYCFQLYQVCNDLQKCFNYFVFNPDPDIDKQKLAPQLFYPFKPQASHKLAINYHQLVDRMPKFYIEEKVDGDRMVLHYHDGVFKFFSRRCRDYTNLYGQNFQIGSLTKYLKHAFTENVHTVILDGEMVAYDYVRHCILPFGTLKQSAIQQAVRQFNTTDMFDEQSSWPIFLIFDVVRINNTNLINHPLQHRKAVLERIINPVPHKFEILPYHLSDSPQDIENAIRSVILDRSEGVMVKNVNSTYHVGERDNSWIKVKPEYLEQFGENLDLTIIGVLPGIKNSYMCGLYDTETKFWRSFCTVANGFTENEFEKIDRLLKHKWTKKGPPPNVRFGRRVPDKFIDPSESIVLEIKARCYDQRTDATYATDSTLRNLYCRRIRDDKSPLDCLLYQDYQVLKSSRAGGVNNPQEVNNPNKRFKLSTKSSLSAAQKRNSLHLKKASKLFTGLKFLVLSDKLDAVKNERISVHELATLIKVCNGDIIKSPYQNNNSRSPVIILSEKLTPSCSNYVKQGFDIVHPDWLFYSINYNKLVPLETCLVFKSQNHAIPSNQDRYGDSYVITPRTDFTKYLLETINVPKLDMTLQDVDFKAEFNFTPLLKLFNKSRFLIILLDSTAANIALSNKVTQFSGVIVTSLPCDYVVVPNKLYDTSRNLVLEQVGRILQQISEGFVEGTKIANIVMESFIDESIMHGIKVDPQDHKVY